MEDEELLDQFEACTLAAEGFHHHHHIKVVWLYLRRHSVLETLDKFSTGLKRFARANGKTTLYHETITWVYVFLIHERMVRNGREQSWQEFVEANPDLFDWRDSILKVYYRDETLRSDLARQIFLWPDNLIN